MTSMTALDAIVINREMMLRSNSKISAYHRQYDQQRDQNEHAVTLHACERHGEHVGMATEMRACMARLSEAWRKHGHELGFAMGIAHGYATLGRIGFEGQFDYSAIGTVVNLAARLCSQALAGQILVDPKVYAAVEAEVDAEPAGELTLKGLSRAIRAFNIKMLVPA